MACKDLDQEDIFTLFLLNMLVGTASFEPTSSFTLKVSARFGVSFWTVFCFAVRKVCTYFIFMFSFTTVFKLAVPILVVLADHILFYAFCHLVLLYLLLAINVLFSKKKFILFIILQGARVK